MDIHAYPGQGLSLSQLVFALNEELKRISHCSSFTLDAVYQLDRDTSAALATIHEWGNSFVPINRLPLEVLSIIPTHLPREDDLLCATSVCRHWRRTFIQHTALWSRLNLTSKRSDLFVKTFLERAKESALDVRSDRLDRADTLALLSTHAQKFRTLNLAYDSWSGIRRFSEVAPGPLPLLRTLEINVLGFGRPGPETMNRPPPLFSGAVNLKKFTLHSEGMPFLNHFVFPNLNTFELSAIPVNAEFHVSQLLDFLEASPTLRTVHIRIEAGILLDVPPERVIVLPNIEVFSVIQDEPGYGIAAHISCPSARLTSLLREQYFEDRILQEVFPTSVSWNAIGPQHMAGTIDEVALEITTAAKTTVSCSLSFSSSGPATLGLGYRMIAGDEPLDEARSSLGEKHSHVFSQASRAVREHPLLSDVKRLRIRDRHRSLARHQLERIAEEAARLFRFVGPLEELILDVNDLRPFLSPFFDPPKSQALLQPDPLPLIKRLTITEPSDSPLNGECVAAIVGFVKSQHMRGVPIELASLHTKLPPVGMAERLGPWVGTLHFDGVIEGDDQELM